MKIRHILIIGFILFIVAAIFTEGYFHPDEHFQLLEFANYKLGGIKGEYLPWEFDEQMRPTFQVFIAYSVCMAFKAIGAFDPYVVTTFLRLITAGCMFILLYRFYERYKVEIQSPKGIWWFGALSFLLWYVPFISVRYSSEAYGTIFMLLAVLMYDVPNYKKTQLGRYLLVGLFLGFSFLSRYQMGFMIFGMGLWILMVRKEKPARISFIALGFIISVGIGLLCDYWFYGEWVSSAYNYFYQNLVVNKAAEFGVSPFWYYAAMTPLVIPVFGIVILPCLIAFFIKKPKHLFTWLIIPFLVIHHLIGHKEFRFLFPLSPFIPFIVVFVLEKANWMKGLRFTKYIFWIINIPLLIIMSCKPAYDNTMLFRYMYHKRNDREVYFLAAYPPWMMYQVELEKKPFIKGKDLKIAFLHEPDFHPHPAEDIPELMDSVQASNKPVLVVLRTIQYEENYKSHFDKKNIRQKVVYQTYHSWLKPINFENWIGRDDVGSWTVIEMSR